jgi:hypothetical protein
MKQEREAAASNKKAASRQKEEDEAVPSRFGGSGANVLMASNAHQLTVGKPKKQIVQSLDQKEKDLLRAMVADEAEHYTEEITKKYHDKFKCKIMSS